MIGLGILVWAVSGIGHLLGLTPTSSELGSGGEKGYENVGLGYVLTLLVIAAPFSLYLLGRYWQRTRPDDRQGLVAVTGGPALVLLLLVIFLPAGKRPVPSSPTQAASQNPTAPSLRPQKHSATVHHHKTAPPPPAPNPIGCPPSSRTLDGVYHPDRLTVLDACRHITGTVILVRPPEDDGDLHFDVRLDAPYRDMLMANNYQEQSGGLVVEFMPRDYNHLSEPGVGDRVSLLGAYVDDTDHAWSELHPVWAVSIDGGPVHSSGPQFGGSSASAYSSEALASCRTKSGARCTGWAGAPAPSSAPAPHGGGVAGGGNCTPGYSPCIPPEPDVDCSGGGGDGPRYVTGPIQVSGSDPYGLDANGDGVACS